MKKPAPRSSTRSQRQLTAPALTAVRGGGGTRDTDDDDDIVIIGVIKTNPRG